MWMGGGKGGYIFVGWRKEGGWWVDADGIDGDRSGDGDGV